MRAFLIKLGPWVDQAIYGAIIIFALAHWQWNARYLAGIAMTLVGFALWTVAKIQLGSSFTVRARAKKLVTNGLYSKFRHPIYLFGGISLLGLFVVWGEIIPLVCFIVFYSTQLLRVKKEDAVLEKAFGDEYRRYKATTWL
jgi:protein-S-isoprenylcysteine O-methyltransferase Ste14